MQIGDVDNNRNVLDGQTFVYNPIYYPYSFQRMQPALFSE